MKLTKAQLERRKKRRHRDKPLRMRWRLILRKEVLNAPPHPA